MQKELSSRGSLLIEAVVALAIMGVALTIGISAGFQKKHIEVEEATYQEMSRLVAAVRDYWTTNNAPPTNLSALGFPPGAPVTNRYGQSYQVELLGNVVRVVADVAPSTGNYLVKALPAASQSVSPSVSPAWPYTFSRVVVQVVEPQAASDVAALDRKLDQASVVPLGGIMLWQGASCPTGFERVSSYDGYYLAGVPAGVTGGSGSHDHGSMNHQHYLNDHSHGVWGWTGGPSPPQPWTDDFGGTCNGPHWMVGWHNHWFDVGTDGGGGGWLASAVGTLAVGANSPPWTSPLLCRKS